MPYSLYGHSTYKIYNHEEKKEAALGRKNCRVSFTVIYATIVFNKINEKLIHTCPLIQPAQMIFGSDGLNLKHNMSSGASNKSWEEQNKQFVVIIVVRDIVVLLDVVIFIVFGMKNVFIGECVLHYHRWIIVLFYICKAVIVYIQRVKNIANYLRNNAIKNYFRNNDINKLSLG